MKLALCLEFEENERKEKEKEERILGGKFYRAQNLNLLFSPFFLLKQNKNVFLVSFYFHKFQINPSASFETYEKDRKDENG